MADREERSEVTDDEYEKYELDEADRGNQLIFDKELDKDLADYIEAGFKNKLR